MNELNSFFITPKPRWTINKINSALEEYFAQIADRGPYDIQVRLAKKGKYHNLTKQQRNFILSFLQGLYK